MNLVTISQCCRYIYISITHFITIITSIDVCLFVCVCVFVTFRTAKNNYIVVISRILEKK